MLNEKNMKLIDDFCFMFSIVNNITINDIMVNCTKRNDWKDYVTLNDFDTIIKYHKNIHTDSKIFKRIIKCKTLFKDCLNLSISNFIASHSWYLSCDLMF